MSLKRTLATARRVLQQLSHDRRSVALMLIVPSMLLVLFKYVYSSEPALFDRIGPQLLGQFPFIIMFLITSITMVRERTSGTLERLLTTPLQRAELVIGYGIAFSLAALVQSGIAAAVTLGPLGLNVHHAVFIGMFALLDALLGTGLGLLMSAFATTEFQAVQFMPAIVLPQLLLCGILNPRANMAEPLRLLSNVLPLSYATDGITKASQQIAFNGDITRDAIVVVGCLIAAVLLAAATLRRRTA